MLAILTVRQDAPSGTDAALGQGSKPYDGAVRLGPGFIVGVGNGLIVGLADVHVRLRTRWMAMFGLIGGPLLCIAVNPPRNDVIEARGPLGVMTIPEAFWELSLGIYLVVKGFRPSPILRSSASRSRPEGRRSG